MKIPQIIGRFLGMTIVVDPKVKPNEVILKYPDGRKEVLYIPENTPEDQRLPLERFGEPHRREVSDHCTVHGLDKATVCNKCLMGLEHDVEYYKRLNRELDPEYY